MRVHELAKKLKISSKELMDELKKQGIKAKNHMELLDSTIADAFLKKHAPLKSSAGTAQPHPTKAKKTEVIAAKTAPAPLRPKPSSKTRLKKEEVETKDRKSVV